VRASEIDAVLHRERLDHGRKRLHPLPVPADTPPDGTMVQAGDESFLILQGRALPWSAAGYGEARAVPVGAMLLTPPSTVRALQAGYEVVLHPTAYQS
jgi:hypothetical protein